MNKAMNRAANLFLLSLFIFGQTYLIADSFGFRVDSAAPLWLAALVVSVWLAASFRHGIFLGLPVSALLLYAAFRRYSPELSAELLDVLDRLAGAYYEHFYAPGSLYSYANAVGSHTMVFLFLGFLLASYMITALTAKNARICLSLIGSLPLFACCIAVNGKPNAAFIVCMLLFWVLLIVGGACYEPNSAGWRAVFASALPCALLLGVLLIFNSPSKYSYTDEDIARSRRLDRVSQLLSGLKDGAGIEPSDSLMQNLPTIGDENAGIRSPSYAAWRSDGGMELQSGYDSALEDTVFLRVKSDSEGYIYLRGSSFGEYTGSGWLAAEQPELGSSLDFAAYAARSSGSTAHKVDIRYITASDTVFLPYYSLSGSRSDTCSPYSGGSEYSAEYRGIELDKASLPADIAEPELEYRGFAYDYYTRLPESTRDSMRSIAAEAGIEPQSADVISQVAEFIRSSGEYDLNVDPYPDGDCAVYFLTQARRGYCVHFATAAAAMYRALGIPARVTEGFLFYADSGRYTAVRGENAHAWVEVYMDGIGWIPVEVTPGSSSDMISGGESNAPDSPLPEESLPPESQAPEEPQPQESAPQQSAAPSPDGGIPAGIISGEPLPQAKNAPKAPWQLIIPAAIIFLSVSAILLRRAVILTRSNRRINSRDGKKAAIEIWRVTQKLSRYGAEPPQAIADCAEKAAFSPHNVSPEEIKACRALLNGLIQEEYGKLSVWKRLIFKFFHCIM